MKPINTKYLELLNKTYDKYKNLDILERPGAVDNNSGKLREKSVDKRCNKINKYKSRETADGRKTKKLHNRRLFSPAEDQIIIENLCHKYRLTSLIYWFRLLWHVPPPLYPATQENAPLADLYAEKVIFLKIAIAFAFDE